jgi:hypothetical protein
LKSAKLVRADTGPSLERSYEVRRIGVTQPSGDLGQGHLRIPQKPLSISESYPLKQTRKGRAALSQPALERSSTGPNDRRREPQIYFGVANH